MPIVNLVTNVKIDNVKVLSTSLSKACSKAWGLQDPDGSNTCASVAFNESLNFNGTYEPAFRLEFMVIDMADAATEKRDAFTKTLCAFIEKTLGIPQSQGYMVLADNEIAMDGVTYETWRSNHSKSA
ncbi:hypothetical protein B0H11DRAFT_2240567 [Mycena galericulata]|nr:hypothetical protein B0H11DRAFT_2240567 [Mycena galericulata]